MRVEEGRGDLVLNLVICNLYAQQRQDKYLSPQAPPLPYETLIFYEGSAAFYLSCFN